MDGIRILWVDARLQKSKESICLYPFDPHTVYCVEELADIERLVRSVHPDLIAFDFDYPDLAGLQALQRTICRHNKPLLMLTDQHYENLAVWALRMRVWDYLVKPVAIHDLLQKLFLIEGMQKSNYSLSRYWDSVPLPSIPIEARFSNLEKNACSTSVARTYIDNHIHEKISEKTVASLCAMGIFEFCRAFKSEHGVTFREYLMKKRLERAAAMLKQTDASITNVAFSVGYRDLSHFARLFKRHTGFCPSRYRQFQQTT